MSLDCLAATRGVDRMEVVDTIAGRLPALTTCRLLGWPLAHWRDVKSWSERLMRGDTLHRDPMQMSDAIRAVHEMAGHAFLDQAEVDLDALTEQCCLVYLAVAAPAWWILLAVGLLRLRSVAGRWRPVAAALAALESDLERWPFEHARLLATTEGLFAGSSTGANLAAATRLGLELAARGESAEIVAIGCDGGAASRRSRAAISAAFSRPRDASRRARMVGGASTYRTWQLGKRSAAAPIICRDPLQTTIRPAARSSAIPAGIP